MTVAGQLVMSETCAVTEQRRTFSRSKGTFSYRSMVRKFAQLIAVAAGGGMAHKFC